MDVFPALRESLRGESSAGQLQEIYVVGSLLLGPKAASAHLLCGRSPAE